MIRSFYTNVAVKGSKILYRGFENGQPVTIKIPYKPTIFLPTQKTSEWTTLSGEPVEPFVAGNFLRDQEVS